jgi:hypothetical protein
MVEERLIDLVTPSIARVFRIDGAGQVQPQLGVRRGDSVGPDAGCGNLVRNLAAPSRTVCQRTVLKQNGIDSCGHAVAMYVEGWMKADAGQIGAATADEYLLDDPFLGEFSRKTLPDYFALIATRLGASGNISHRDLSFRLHGPMPNGGRPDQSLFWREAPSLGLSGTSIIAAGRSGVFCERISYELNMATEMLRRPCAMNGANDAT